MNTNPEVELDSIAVTASGREAVRPQYHERVATVQQHEDFIMVMFVSASSQKTGHRIVRLTKDGMRWTLDEDLNTYRDVVTEASRLDYASDEPHPHFEPGSGPAPEYSSEQWAIRSRLEHAGQDEARPEAWVTKVYDRST